ncbi:MULTISPECIES: pseudouridine synthase [Hyphomonas]|uniref:Dual-specificity RNA pseudouridine synthase RluF n=1 Tax=Hyphomonas adhaerens TaxID=81029 RepID=A0A3B9GTL0_9PROT|nr:MULTISPECIES: pseudouridine synthase [Hyphomonas]MBB39125.1 pseudouridylate synthase [Hyphomonas sp.]HAE25800.1 rRNA pseudouridine synthase [Hyphomonas adhaerens]|tara:strand:+ start:729 stop:1775 length:1047 start_codon:yes stop_codon:yes gene_type:complete
MAWTKTYEGAEPLRINKWLAEEGVCSRREADALILKGLVKVDGEAAIAGQKIEAGQTLTLLQKATRQLDNRLSLIFHKPEGIVSGTPEAGEIPAVRLITAETLSGKAHAIPGRYNKLAPLGRLDKDSRGLLVLSEDGVLAKALIGPESTVDKEYLVKVKGDVTPDKLALLRHGLELDGRKLKPAQVDQVKAHELRFVLNEGRNRQIRRMCQLVDLRVADLMRVRVGSLELAGLPEGKWRPISARERDALLSGAAPSPRPSSPRAPREAQDRPPRETRERPQRGERPARGERPDRPPRPGKPSGKPGGKSGSPRGDRKPDSREEKPVNPMRGPKFKRTKLGPRKRSPIK